MTGRSRREPDPGERDPKRVIAFSDGVIAIAVIPFAAAVLASSFRAGQGERTAVVVHGIVFELAAAVFNVISWYARSNRRLLANTIDAAGVRSITRRFLLGLAWIGAGTLLGALLPLLGVAMFASFIIFFWLPICGEIGAARPRPVQAGEWALSRTPSSEAQPRADQHAPGK